MKQLVVCLLIAVAIVIPVDAQKLTLLWKTDPVFKVPESVLFDAKTNVLYVSNIDGASSERDGRGFISRIDPNGNILELEWVKELNAPKGMGISGGNLYVADLGEVAVIDIALSKIVKKIEIKGARLLNDVAIDDDENIYVSDSGTGKVHRVMSDGTYDTYFYSTDFARINGLLALKDSELYIADAGSGIHYRLSADKKLSEFSRTSQGADGIVRVGRNGFIVSSWGGELYFVDEEGVANKLLDTRENNLNSADIAFNSRKRVLYVPTFLGNSVMAYSFAR